MHEVLRSKLQNIVTYKVLCLEVVEVKMSVVEGVLCDVESFVCELLWLVLQLTYLLVTHLLVTFFLVLFSVLKVRFEASQFITISAFTHNG